MNFLIDIIGHESKQNVYRLFIMKSFSKTGWDKSRAPRKGI